MNALLAVGATHSFYLSFLIFKRKSRTFADHLLMILLITYGIEFSLLFSSFEFHRENLAIPLLNSNLLAMPFFYLYVKTITGASQKLQFKNFLFFIPYLLSTIYWSILFVSSEEHELIQLFYNTQFTDLPILFIIVQSADNFLYPVFLIFILMQQKRYQNLIKKNYSYTEGIDFQWIKLLTILTLIDWFITLLYFIAAGADFNDNSVFQKSAAFSTLFVFIIGYYGLKKGYLYQTDKTPVFAAPNKGGQSLITDNEATYYSEKLTSYMKKEKPYLINSLSLNDLANSLAVSRNILSWVINEKLNSNFYNYINRHRVEEFKRAVKDKTLKNYTILAIALDCGFNSKATFNRIFKQNVGVTPKQYIKSLNLF